MRNLLQKYVEGNCTSQENLQVLNWIEQSDEHLKEYQAVRKLYDISIWNTNLHKQTKKKFSFKLILRESVKIAAVLVVGFLLSTAVIKYNTPEAQIQKIHVPPGQRAELDLSDGTKVWLNSGSTLTFPSYFAVDNVRKVTLEGEGFFDVQKIDGGSFLVQTDQFDVHVLGTKFNVRAYNQNEEFQVDLLNGSVEVSSDKLSRAIKLLPNQSILYKDNRVVINEIKFQDYFQWRKGLLCFENETVGDLFEKVELYYDVKINLENKDLLKHSYSGKFWIRDGVEHILKVLQFEHKFNYKIKHEEKEVNII